jgi:formylglycine-generating enzyme required for sulfatase activity
MNPVGPDTGFVRVIRGGGFRIFASSCRSAIRNDSYYPDFGYRNVGFRVVLASEQP